MAPKQRGAKQGRAQKQALLQIVGLLRREEDPRRHSDRGLYGLSVWQSTVILECLPQNVWSTVLARALTIPGTLEHRNLAKQCPIPSTVLCKTMCTSCMRP